MAIVFRTIFLKLPSTTLLRPRPFHTLNRTSTHIHPNLEQLCRNLSSSTTAKAKAKREPQPLLNDALRKLRKVRLISEKGENCGTMTGEQAIRRAKAVYLDVVQVSVGEGQIPILRILDYTAVEDNRRKKAYEKNKADKELKKLQKREQALKQVRLSPVTDTHDIDIKVKRAKHFLLDGYRVKIYMMFRRGHGTLHESAKLSLVRVALELGQYGKVQGIPPGRSVHEFFDGPKKGLKRRRYLPNVVDAGAVGHSQQGGRAEYGDEEEEEEEEEEEHGTPKKRPLEILLYPLPRKERQVVSEQST